MDLFQSGNSVYFFFGYTGVGCQKITFDIHTISNGSKILCLHLFINKKINILYNYV